LSIKRPLPRPTDSVMTRLTRFGALGPHRLRKVTTVALLLASGSGPACGSSSPGTPDSGGTPSTGGASGSGTSRSGTSGSGTSGSGTSGSGTSGSGTSGSGTSGSGTSGSGTSGSGTSGSGTSGSGTSGSGGTNMAAGSNNGGAAGKAGSSSAGTSGAPAPVPFQCDPSDGIPVGTPNDCTPTSPSDVCQSCIQAKCCAEYAACYAIDPGNQCGWGGPAKVDGIANYGGEIACIQACLIATVAESGTAPGSQQVSACASHCATSSNNGATKECGSVIGAQTSNLVGCLLNSCSTVCFGG
jgi:hypothetical protein